VFRIPHQHQHRHQYRSNRAILRSAGRKLVGTRGIVRDVWCCARLRRSMSRTVTRLNSRQFNGTTVSVGSMEAEIVRTSRLTRCVVGFSGQFSGTQRWCADCSHSRLYLPCLDLPLRTTSKMSPGREAHVTNFSAATACGMDQMC
jgi:hypothetical protein